MVNMGVPRSLRANCCVRGFTRYHKSSHLVASRFIETRKLDFDVLAQFPGPDYFLQIPFAIDFRPYFTIHDKEYASIVMKKAPSCGIVLGVTNPLFMDLCDRWPQRLCLDQRPHSER